MNSEAIIKQNEWLIQQYFSEVWNKGKVELLDTLLTAGYINHSSSVVNPPPGPAGLKPIVIAMRQAFPDLQYEINELIITAGRVVARVTMSGSHEGDFFGIAATHKKVAVNQVNIEYITEGRIAEHWRLTDELSLLKQLGVIAI